jgi:adenosylcobinamide kinase/adenosylcobinamide-phosphate guanylyltransferase
MKRCLVTGGSRSGKSRYALKQGEGAKRPFYIATGWAGDDEMAERIKKHQAERDERWNTIETKVDLAEAVKEAEQNGADFIIVDCLTLWTSNMLFPMSTENVDVEQKIEQLIEAIKMCSVPLYLVTNEVGSGIMPLGKETRQFGDQAGLINQQIAEVVDEVILTVSGIPMKIKG